MTTTTAARAQVPAAARPAHNAPVRIGRGASVHLGVLAAGYDPAAPVYSAACGAGNRYPDENTPLRVATAAPVAEAVTCRNCTRMHAEAVARVNAQAAGQLTIAPAAEAADAQAARLGAQWAAIITDPRMSTRDGRRRAQVGWIVAQATGARFASPRWYAAAVAAVLAAAWAEAAAARV